MRWDPIRGLNLAHLMFEGWGGPSSCHAPSVLTTWSINEVVRRTSRCLSRAEQIAFVRVFTARYCSMYGLDEAALLHTQPCLRSVARSESFWPRLILPFNFVWHRANLHRILQAIAEEFGYPRLETGWKNHYPHLIVALKRLNGHLSQWPERYRIFN